MRLKKGGLYPKDVHYINENNKFCGYTIEYWYHDILLYEGYFINDVEVGKWQRQKKSKELIYYL